MSKNFFFLCFMTLGFLNCNRAHNKAEKLLNTILLDSEKSIKSPQDTIFWKNKLNIFSDAADCSESDSLWARYTMLSGDLQATIPGRALFAIRSYMTLHDSIPSSSQAAMALFSAALVFEQQLNDSPRAVQTLTLLIDTYPKTNFADRASKYRDMLIFGNDSILLEKIHTWQETSQSPPL